MTYKTIHTRNGLFIGETVSHASPLEPAASLSTRQAARIDAKVDALVSAIAPLNT